MQFATESKKEHSQQKGVWNVINLEQYEFSTLVQAESLHVITLIRSATKWEQNTTMLKVMQLCEAFTRVLNSRVKRYVTTVLYDTIHPVLGG